MTKPSISAILIIKNEEQMLENCLNTLKWCDEVIVVDDESTDKSAKIAQKMGVTVVNYSSDSFAELREKGAEVAKSDWLFYVDADERVSPALAKEIQKKITTQEATVYSVNRKNILYGSEFKHGGWENDWVERVFFSNNLKGWYGSVHESPQYTGQTSRLMEQLIHLTHRDTITGLKKTTEWTPLEAHALYSAGVSKVTAMTLIRKGLMEFLRRLLFKKGYKDGMPGFVEATVQAINRILVYIQVWELQQSPQLPEKYQAKEAEIQKLWKQSRVSE